MSVSARRSLAAGVGAALVLAVGLPLFAQQKEPSKDEKKRQQQLQEALRREARPVAVAITYTQNAKAPTGASTYLVDPKQADQPDPEAIKAVSPAPDPATVPEVGWRTDKMKAADGKVYVPYTLALPASSVPSGRIAVFLRVVTKGATDTDVAASGDKPAGYTFQDYFTTQPRLTDEGKTAVIMRSFAAAPGDYDVYFGIRLAADEANKKKDQPVRVIVLKQGETLPNFWNGELTTSTVVVTNKVDQVQGQVSPDAARERPYLFGSTEFVPSEKNTFKKADELSVVFQVYNPKLEAGKPDVTIEYTFHQKLPEGEKYFNKTNPQQLNAQTLPPNFDVTATQMLPGGQSVPLASFPPGDYRMEIKVTDKLANKSLTRDVFFTVLPS
jgi:hypothetical protein